MQEPSSSKGSGLADLLMVMLCASTSCCVLASPLVPSVFDDTVSGFALFLLSNLVLTTILSSIGIKLNHLAVRQERVTFWRERDR
jgi:hypothetical protein